MSLEVFQMIQKINREEVEIQLALQCAPFLMRLKISNLLIVRQEEETGIIQLLKQLGIHYFRLQRFQGKTIFLVFYKDELEQFLAREEVWQIFREQGYEQWQLGRILLTFGKRYENYRQKGQEFPHEMGLLLGYPPEDVQGFMKDGGKNCLYSGYWKVYADVEAKKKLFASYRNATTQLFYLMSDHYSLQEILQVESRIERQKVG